MHIEKKKHWKWQMQLMICVLHQIAMTGLQQGYIVSGIIMQKQIEDYFSRNERLGYTIFVQSPLSQPLVHRNREMYEKFAKQQNSPVEDMLSEQGRDDIKRVEGILIESFRKKYGHFPPWNNIGGSTKCQTKVMGNNINIVRSFCQSDNYEINPIVSRSTIRELSQNPEWEWYENFLHVARMNLLILGMEYDKSLEYEYHFFNIEDVRR